MGTKSLRTGTVYVFEASWWDVMDRKSYTPANGTCVMITQPHGCPRNGTMGHCYVNSFLTGEFIGLVAVASLQPRSTER